MGNYMTIPPKEKAKQLKERFEDGLTLKDCAKIAVDEIIESRKDDRRFDDRLTQGGSGYASLHPMGLSYWLEVKKELNKNEQR